jgi:2-dehydro-3-deoxyglucarate aldolase/4-hydroxy-2-oxoheptanedioate aldolase
MTYGSCPFIMRPNTVKKKLAAGGTAVGTMIMEFGTTGVPRIAAAAGAEFAVFDMEHTGWSLDHVRTLMAASRCAELTPLVRPPAIEYHWLARTLDVGAAGVVCPFVDTPEQAEFIVRATRYPPAGRRGAAFGMAHDDYVLGDVGETMRSANAEVMVVVQIESARGLANVEQIAATPGVDAVWMGQFDLTASLGIPGQFQHPEFLAAQARILAACRKANVAAGYGSLSVGDIAAAGRQGFRLLVYLADLWIYQRALAEGISAIRSAEEEAGEARA